MANERKETSNIQLVLALIGMLLPMMGALYFVIDGRFDRHELRHETLTDYIVKAEEKINALNVDMIMIKCVVNPDACATRSLED